MPHITEKIVNTTMHTINLIIDHKNAIFVGNKVSNVKNLKAIKIL